jgi:hypothetical protein
MGNFEVLHSRKIKTMTGGKEVIKHNLRKKDNLEEFIDKTKSHHNYYFGATEENFFVVYERFIAHLPRKIQRNASRLIEFVVSFSHEYGEGWEDNPELKKKIEDYFNKAEQFLKRRYGDFIICRADHYDEFTPHSHILLVPLCKNKDGKLKFSSSEFLGGIKGLCDLHDKFHAEIGNKYGLERGIRNSRTKHKDLKNYESWEQEQRKLLEEKKKEADENLAKIQQQQTEIQQFKEKLKKLRKLLIQKMKEVKTLKKRVFDLNGDILKRDADLSKREQEYEEIQKKSQSAQIPQIPVPPVVVSENTRKKWRDDAQVTIDKAFNMLAFAFNSLHSKYSNLLDKFNKLTLNNAAHKNRADKAEKDLLEMPINEIIAVRNQKAAKPQEQQASNEQEGHSR